MSNTKKITKMKKITFTLFFLCIMLIGSYAQVVRIHGLAVVTEFNDFQYGAATSTIDSLINQQSGYTRNGHSGSLYEWYKDQSNNKYEITHHVVRIRLAKNRSYFAGANNPDTGLPWDKGQAFADSVLVKVKSLYPNGIPGLTRYKGIATNGIGSWLVIFPGSGVADGLGNVAFPVHSGQTLLSDGQYIPMNHIALATIGVGSEINHTLNYVAHESSHAIFRYPDYYTPRGDNPNGIGNAGSFCIMGMGAGRIIPQQYSGPLLVGLGGVKLINIVDNVEQTLSVKSNARDTIYRYVNPNNSREYFMIQAYNHGKWYPVLNLDGRPMDVGLAIWHVVENSTNPMSPWIKLVQADGQDLMNDPSAPAATQQGCDARALFGNVVKTVNGVINPMLRWRDGSIPGLYISNISLPGDSMSFTVEHRNSTIVSSVVGLGGSVSPIGVIAVNSGDSKTFTFNPDFGFKVNDVLVDGVSQGAISSYTFDQPNEDHTISVNFIFAAPNISPTTPNAVWSLLSVSSEESVGSALKAFDNIASTYWHTKWSGTSDPYPHYISINLGAKYVLSGVGYLPRQDYTNGRIKDFDIFASLDGINWQYVRSGVGKDDKIERTYGFNPIVAQYIKIYAKNACNGSNYAGAAEIRAYGTAYVDEPEISKTSWSIKAFDSQQSGSPATNLIDGNVATMWHTQYNPTTVTYPHYVEIDLGGTYQLSKFRFLPRQDYVNGRIAKYSIFISEDGVNWGDTVAAGVWDNTIAEKVVYFPTTSGRYFKLLALSEVNSNAWASGNEIYLHGTFIGGFVPVVNFTANTTTINVGESVTFTDLSTNNPSSWEWTTPGGTPASINVQHPVVSYSAYGTYPVTLIAGNGDGNGIAVTKTDYITVAAVYCNAESSNYANDYIKSVKVGGVTNSSAGSIYSDFTTVVIPLTIGTSNSYTLSPNANKRTEYWKVYIDYNRNGVFDADELVANVNGRGSRTGSFTVPATALVGKTRMRVIMKYGSSVNNPCELFNFGEVEDYSVEISGTPQFVKEINTTQTEELADENVSIFSTDNEVRINVPEGYSKVEILDIAGRKLVSQPLSSGLNIIPMNVRAGIYIVNVYFNDKATSKKIPLFM